MNVTEIVQQLRDERSKLDAAIQALEGVGGGGSSPAKRRGRPPGSSNKPSTATAVSAPRKRRVMSPAARKRIAESMRNAGPQQRSQERVVCRKQYRAIKISAPTGWLRLACFCLLCCPLARDMAPPDYRGKPPGSKESSAIC